MRLRLRVKTPHENPRNTLVRYAMAIDEQFDDDAASPKQRADLAMLIEAMQRIKIAQEQRLGRRDIQIRVGIALGLCESYMHQYDITPPGAPST